AEPERGKTRADYSMATTGEHRDFNSSKKTPERTDGFGCRITPQFSGGALTSAERRERKMKWRARGATAMGPDRPLQLLVIRQPTPPERSAHSCETANPLLCLALPDSVTDAGRWQNAARSTTTCLARRPLQRNADVSTRSPPSPSATEHAWMARWQRQ